MPPRSQCKKFSDRKLRSLAKDMDWTRMNSNRNSPADSSVSTAKLSDGNMVLRNCNEVRQQRMRAGRTGQLLDSRDARVLPRGCGVACMGHVVSATYPHGVAHVRELGQ